MREFFKVSKPLAVLLFFVVPALLVAQTAITPDALKSYQLGRDAEARGQTDSALTYYNEAVRICTGEINGNSATMDSYVVLTWTLQRQQKYSDVISWSQKALQIKKDEWRIIETMGEAYFYMDRYTEALKCMEQYVGNMPQGAKTATAYFFIGEIYRVQRKFHYADIAYTTAVRMEAGNPLWWYRMGLARESAGENNFAIEAYERSLRLDPNNARTVEALARVRSS
jgi:tetratricopeptide (TPR) repeat protein